MMQDLEPFFVNDDEACAEEDEESGAEIVRGTLRRSNDGCGWQIDGIDLIQYLAQYHGQELTLAIDSAHPAPAEPDRSVCGTCGFPLDELGDCLRCRWYSVVKAREQRENLFQEIDQIVETSWGNWRG